MSFILLRRALESSGRRVHVNAFALARRNPDFPVGLCGYQHILDDWNLPNPVVLGPGLYDHPKRNPRLFQDRRFRSYLTFCEWMRDLFAHVYDRHLLDLWFGGIDLAQWPDMSKHPKEIDVLVYDKIRWNRDTLLPSFREPLLNELSRNGLRYEIIRYGRYTLAEYRKQLARSRSMLFLCEHETQGMAYQEAMACNLPILAWDQGFWLDPHRALFESDPVPASSVPYFSPACGHRFTGVEDFSAALSHFMASLTAYTPRRWVAENLSMTQSAALYVQAYAKAAAPSQADRGVATVAQER
jgi:hypothetical protein